MKKKLESELISIAHRILKLTGKEDLPKMQKEIALLYQKIVVLNFLESQFNGEIPYNVATSASFFDALEEAFNNKVTDSVEVDEQVYVNIDHEQDEALMEPAIEKIKDIVAQMPQETAAVDDLVDEINEQPTSTPVEQDLSALSPSYNQLPIFAAVDEQEEPQKQNESPTSLNEKLKPTGFQIGLNDRLAFVNHLFENNNEDYDRVISQLSTMDSFEEISDFIENIIKPDYNNWAGKEEYETRFLDTIENRFKS
jgi:hypothetical protein